MAEDPGLFRRILGPDFEALPPALRFIHDPGDGIRAEGRADLLRGSSRMAGILSKLLGLPSEKRNQPVRFDMLPDSATGGEIWRRDFNGEIVETRHQAHSDRKGRMLERFGTTTFVMEIVLEQNGIAYRMKGLRLLGVPVPAFLGPRIEARETDQDGYFVFESTVSLPIVGTLMRYRGWLVPRAISVDPAQYLPSREVEETAAMDEAHPPTYRARTDSTDRADD